MSLFNLSIRRSGTGKPFRQGIKQIKNPCLAAAYQMRTEVLSPFIEELGSVDIRIHGGIAPYSWVSLSAGSSFGVASTWGTLNTVTCNTIPSDGYVRYQVTDACGNVRQGAVRLFDFNAGAGCEGGTEVSCPELSLSGDATYEVGSTYTATGGVGPLTFTVSKGAFTRSGNTITITEAPCVSGETAVVTVTVTDSCTSPEAQTAKLYPKQLGVVRTFYEYADGTSIYYYDEYNNLVDGASAARQAKHDEIHAALVANGCNNPQYYSAYAAVDTNSDCLTITLSGSTWVQFYRYYDDNGVDIANSIWGWESQPGSCYNIPELGYVPLNTDINTGITPITECRNLDGGTWSIRSLYVQWERYVCP